MSEVAGVETAGHGPSATSDQSTASTAAPPVRQRDDHARSVEDRAAISRPRQAAGCGSSSTLDEGGDYVTEWDPRLT
jgi:hypothetical protein